MPKWVVPTLVLLAALAFTVFALVARSRETHSPLPRIDFIPDMDLQDKFKTQTENPMFADGRAMRRPVQGTVARGQLNADGRFYRGVDGATWTTSFPMKIDDNVMKRGRERYNIFCAPCHGLAGNGDGMTAKRADSLQEGTWTPPSSYHTDRLRAMPVGEVFNTITYGIRKMPPYGSQVPEADRWAIIAYVRALQRSRNATMDDVPDEIRPALK